MKEDGRTGTAFAVNLRRNTEGIKDLKIWKTTMKKDRGVLLKIY
jgi:hypothetical protein